MTALASTRRAAHRVWIAPALWLVHLGMLVVTAAGMLKLAGMQEFWRAVSSWSLVPGAMKIAAWVLVPVIELGLGASWFLGIARRVALVGSLVVLGGFTLAYVWHALAAQPPDCGCFGVLARHQRWLEETWFVIARNTSLMAVLGAGTALSWRRVGTSKPSGLRLGGPGG